MQTVDFFPPVVDDPYAFGQIAAANALSDIYAMGAVPKLAMNLLCYPSCLPQETVRAILAGGADKVREAGAALAGGTRSRITSPNTASASAASSIRAGSSRMPARGRATY